LIVHLLIDEEILDCLKTPAWEIERYGNELENQVPDLLTHASGGLAQLSNPIAKLMEFPQFVLDGNRLITYAYVRFCRQTHALTPKDDEEDKNGS